MDKINESVSEIKTGVDRLVSLIKDRGKISLPEAAKELGVSPVVVEEWAEFLEEEGIISTEYKFSKLWLIERKLTKKDIEEKVKEFHGKKDVLIRKAESFLSYLDRQNEDLTKLRDEFNNIKEEISKQAEKVKDELHELERYEELKRKADEQLRERDLEFQNKINEMERKIDRLQKRYNEILAEIGIEENVLKSEKIKADSIKKIEEQFSAKLKAMEESIQKVKKKITDEDARVSGLEEHIKRLKELADSTKKTIEEEKREMKRLIKESQEHEKRIVESHQRLIKKAAENSNRARSNILKGQDLTKKFNNFMKKRIEVELILDKINIETRSLKKDLNEFLNKVTALKISSQSVNIEKQVEVLEKKIKEIDEKKSIFEEEIKKLYSLIKR